MLTEKEILQILQQSDRWGINEQPEDVEAFASFLATLPCRTVRMKNDDTCIITFERELDTAEAEQLRERSNLTVEDEDPFDPRKPGTEAFLWWD